MTLNNFLTVITDEQMQNHWRIQQKDCLSIVFQPENVEWKLGLRHKVLQMVWVSTSLHPFVEPIVAIEDGSKLR